MAADQSLLFSSAAAVTAAFNCRLAWAVAWPRKLPAARFAALSHKLMNGFFFNQGLNMALFRIQRATRRQVSG